MSGTQILMHINIRYQWNVTFYFFFLASRMIQLIRMICVICWLWPFSSHMHPTYIWFGVCISLKVSEKKNFLPTTYHHRFQRKNKRRILAGTNALSNSAIVETSAPIQSHKRSTTVKHDQTECIPSHNEISFLCLLISIFFFVVRMPFSFYIRESTLIVADHFG